MLKFQFDCAFSRVEKRAQTSTLVSNADTMIKDDVLYTQDVSYFTVRSFSSGDRMSLLRDVTRAVCCLLINKYANIYK